MLVGHSIAGYNLRVFADQYPDELAGLVFLDATDSGLDEFSPPPPAIRPERLDMVTSAAQVSLITDLGDLPVYVLTATIGTADRWFDLQQVLVGLSTNSVQVEVDASHNNIYTSQPQAIVDAVAWIVSQSG
ncbi:MAG: hypothetical protein BMS9Abin12_2247 [Acidimicrobiia bacterium]|nr:MAG: hypothetical protein BMS9Abin12_2247 [Acidimicrobiia bacterium]